MTTDLIVRTPSAPLAPMGGRPTVLLVGGEDVDARIELMRCLEQDWTVGAVGSSPELASAFERAGFPYYYYPLKRTVSPWADLHSRRCLTRLFREVRPQVVHTFDSKPNIFGRLAARAAGVPAVVGTICGLGTLYSDDSLSTRVLRTISETLQRNASHQSSMTICQNHDDFRYLTDAGIVPRKRATVILGSGVHTEQLASQQVTDKQRQSVRRDAGLTEQHLVVTMISRVMRSKGVFELAEAAARVQQAHPHVRFLLVGPRDIGGADSLSEGELAKLQAHITCLGKRTDIPAVLGITDIFVLPSFYREGIPRVLLEAAAMGIPLIATDTAGCREIVHHEENGLLIPVKDASALAAAILRLVEDAPLRRHFGQASRRRAVQEFDLRIVAEQITAVYRQCLSGVPALPAMA